jgi:hypothetical protein
MVSLIAILYSFLFYLAACVKMRLFQGFLLA